MRAGYWTEFVTVFFVFSNIYTLFMAIDEKGFVFLFTDMNLKLSTSSLPAKCPSSNAP